MSDLSISKTKTPIIYDQKDNYNNTNLYYNDLHPSNILRHNNNKKSSKHFNNRYVISNNDKSKPKPA